MSVIIRLQNLPWSANSLDIRQFFHGLSIPEGGVHIVGGEVGDAFIAFSTDEDARQAMMMDGNMLKGEKVRLLLSSRTQMHQVIEDARKESEQARYLGRVQKSGQHPSQMPGQMGNMLGQMPGHMSGQMPGHLSGQIPGMPGMPGQMPGQMPQMGMQLPSTPEQLAALVSQMAGVPGLLESVPALAGLAPHLLGQQNQPSPGPAVSAEDVDSRVEPERKEESKRKDRRDRSRSRDRRDRSRDRDRNRDRKRGHRSRDRSRDRGSGRSRKRSRTRSRDRSKMSRDRKEDNKPQQQPLLKTPEVGPDGQFGNQKSELLLQPAVPTPVPAPVPPPLDQDNRLPIMPGMPSLPLIPGIPRMPLPPTMSGLANLAGMNIPRPGGSNLGQTEDSSKAFPSPNQDRLPGRDAWPPSLGAEPGSGNGPSRYFIGETDLRRENPLQASGRTFSGPNMDRGMDLGEGSIFDRRPMNHERSMLDNRGMTDRDRSVPGLMERNRLGPGMLERNRLGPGMMDRDGSGMMDRDRQGPGMMDRERTGSGMMDRERPGSGMMDRDRPGLGMMDRDRSGLGIMDRDRHVPGLLERDRLGPGMMDPDRGGQGGGSVERSGPGPMERDRFMHYDDRPGFMGRGGHSGVNMGGPGPYNRQGPNMMARHGPGMMDRSGPGMFDRPGGRGMVERNGPGFAERGRPGLMDRGGPGMMGRGGGPPLMGRGGPGPRMFGAGDHAGPIGMHHNGSDTDYVPHDEDMDLDEDSQDSRPGLERTDRYERHDRFDRPDRPDRPDRDRPEGRSRERRDRDRDRGRDRRSGDRDRRGYRESSRSDRDRSRSDRRDGKDEFGRDIDTRNRKDRAFESDLCVEVRDMSRNTGFADVRRFFTGFVIPSSGLKLINDSQGNRTGIAYVRFLRKRDREEALSFSGSTLKNEVVQVLPIPDEVFEKAVDSYVPPKHFADQGNQEVITLEDTDTNLTCIKCEQVPYGSKEEDLKKLCAGLQGEVFLDTSEENDGQTVAYIKFKRHEDAKKFASSKPTIQGTELCLTLCPETELSDMLINGVAEKKNDISSHGNIDRDNSLNGEQNDDLTHHSSPAKNTKEEVAVTPLDTDCVILKNLPPSVRDRDILDFFSDVGLVPVRIHVMIDTYGKPTGEAFCEFHNGVDAAKALRKDSNHMGKFIVNVVPVSRDDMNASLGAPVSNVGPMGSMGPMHMGPMGLGPRPPYNMMHQRSMGGVPRAMGILGPRPFRQDLQDLPVEGFGKPGCIIACENIPFRAEIDDILDFFAEFELTKENVIRRFDERGRATGDARVAFNNPSDAQTALHELRGKRLQGRQIFMQLL